MSFLIRSLPIFFLFLISSFLPLHAATITVNDTGDSAATDGTCTLREAITSANTDMMSGSGVGECDAGSGADEIVFDASLNGSTINLSSALPDVTESLIITGPGADNLTIDGNFGGYRHFSFGTAGTYTLFGLRLASGDPSANGGSVSASQPGVELTIDSCELSGNSASSGGAILVSNGAGPVTIKNSLLIANEAAGGGGAIYYISAQPFNIVNTTISGNRAEGNGGGIFVQATGGALTILNSTITDNTSDENSDDSGDGGGINQTSGTVTLQNTLVAGNIDNGDEATDCEGTIASNGFNILGDDTGCTFTPGTGDQVDIIQDGSFAIAEIIGEIADNGGATQTHALVADSPALDQGRPEADGGCVNEDDDPLTTDQRGFTRPSDGNNNGTAQCDIGAFEAVCGNGIVEASESCDNGTSNSDSEANACRTTCENFSCGDGVTDSNESCDDGNNVNGDGCRDDCSVESCGDGIVDAGEDCDDGNANSDTEADACRTTCVDASCGDNVTDTGEQCDDGNANNQDSCSSSCMTIMTDSEAMSNTNPDVNFDDLTAGEGVTINAPDPTNGSSSFLLAQSAPANCECTWSAEPAASGAFTDADVCTADFTPEAGSGELQVEVDCGSGGVGFFTQAFQASTPTTMGSSGGCSLIRR